MALLVTSLTFTIVVGLVLSGYWVVTAESEASQRLRALVPTLVSMPRSATAARRQSVLSRVLSMVGQYGVGSDNESIAQALSVAGLRGRNTAVLFIGVRTVISVVPALIVLVTNISTGEALPRSILLGVGTWFFGHMLANLWLRRRRLRRMQDVMGALPDSLDLMVVCLEAGLGLNATIARVGQERASVQDALGAEFAQVSFELREGRNREEALRALGERNGVEDLRSLAALIIQSDRLGASMAKTLRSHADVLRTKRRQRAEEAARKLPIKMLFPLALLILPPLFVMTLGPAILQLQDLGSFLTTSKQH